MTLRNRTLVDRLIERALGTDATAEATPPEEPATADTTEQPEESE